MNEEDVRQHVCASVQGRPDSGGSWYSPARDISTLVPPMMMCALQRWEKEDSNLYREATRLGYTGEDVGVLALALGAFTNTACVLEPATPEEAFVKSGLLNCPRELQTLLLAELGEIALGAFWCSVRAATTAKEGETPKITQYDPEKLAVQASRVGRLFKMSPLKRKYTKFWWRVRDGVHNWLQARTGEE